MGILVPADFEQIAYDLLRARFPNVGPVPRGGGDGDMLTPFIAYEITGGSRRNMVTDSAVVMIRCYSPSRGEASRVCREAYAVLMAEPYANDSAVRSAKSVGHPVCYPDPDTKKYRYQASVQWQLRPEIL